MSDSKEMERAREIWMSLGQGSIDDDEEIIAKALIKAKVEGYKQGLRVSGSSEAAVDIMADQLKKNWGNQNERRNK